MRRFYLERLEDVSGTSGVGKVAEGVQFTTGTVVITWLSPFPSVTWFLSLEALEHVHGHNGRTRIIFIDASSS